MSQRYSFDPLCRDLAEVFLLEKKTVSTEDRNELAQAIQDAIEAWLAARSGEKP